MARLPDNIVRHSVAEKGVYGINQKIKEGKHNTHSTDDSSEDTTSNDAAARSTDSGVSGTGAC